MIAWLKKLFERRPDPGPVFCRDCKHGSVIKGHEDFARCYHPANAELDLVTGHWATDHYASTCRKPGFHCGPRGRHYKAKEA